MIDLKQNRFGNAEQLAECLSSMFKALDSVPSTAYTKHGGTHPQSSSRVEWENQKFKVILGYVERLRSVCNAGALI